MDDRPEPSSPLELTSENLASVEEETHRLARYVWGHLGRRQPSVFERRWWDDRILSAAMADESLKVQMFRFVDVLPRLKTHSEITRHLQEYFEEIREHLPWAAQLIRLGLEHLEPSSVLSRVLAYNARSNALRMAKRFIAGTNVEEVTASVASLRRQGYGFTLDLLGEAVISEPEAEDYQRQYLELLNGLSAVVNQWPEDPQIDCDHRGPLPRVNLSIKLSALVSHFRPIDARGTAESVKQRLRPLLRAAQERGAYLHVDMEQFAYKTLTREIFQQVLMEPEFRDFEDVGIVVQAYLKESDRDLRELREWVAQRGTSISVRLVKGAYWDFETVSAGLNHWPVPVYQRKWESDAAYERQARFLLENHHWLRPAFGSHNLRSLSNAVAWANVLKVPSGAFELQMLYGMAGDQAQVFTELGHRVRIYTPFGQLIPGMAYLVRRLLENTSNDSFLRHSYAADVSLENLLMNPVELGQNSPPLPDPTPIGFQNEPLLDFTREDVRIAMQEAIEHVEENLGETYPLVINGRREDARTYLNSKNPSRKDQLVGKVASATTEHALQAIDAAQRAFKPWSRTEATYRAEYLELIAQNLRSRRMELAAWQIFESGKPWIEADADVAEAIDFCLYYARQMRELSEPRATDLPGEENAYFYRPRGVTVVIAPWNFPLAILTGMTAAAIVAGNTVIMKPAEQASVMAAKLMEVIAEAGLPDGVVNYLPGVGEEIGPVLVGSPDVDVIAFTGSRPVGLSINQLASEPHKAADSVKHVIAEMGGKNAIIVDTDADLDEAVLGVMHSAFGYAGQKCSACSRVIVVGDAYDEFLNRLIAATKSFTVGPASDPASCMGPVIDGDSFRRIRDTIETGKAEGELVLGIESEALVKKGWFIGPHIFANVAPESSLAREEIFGPVLLAFKVPDFSAALELANNTDYALTGGVYSRSPANLKRARQEFQVGNLYLNRPITGALVGRQPFGGFKMSGIGSKAGGPDYLKQFLIPVNITENTLRRGFAPVKKGK